MTDIDALFTGLVGTLLIGAVIGVIYGTVQLIRQHRGSIKPAADSWCAAWQVMAVLVWFVIISFLVAKGLIIFGRWMEGVS